MPSETYSASSSWRSSAGGCGRRANSLLRSTASSGKRVSTTRLFANWNVYIDLRQRRRLRGLMRDIVAGAGLGGTLYGEAGAIAGGVLGLLGAMVDDAVLIVEGRQDIVPLEPSGDRSARGSADSRRGGKPIFALVNRWWVSRPEVGSGGNGSQMDPGDRKRADTDCDGLSRWPVWTRWCCTESWDSVARDATARSGR